MDFCLLHKEGGYQGKKLRAIEDKTEQRKESSSGTFWPILREPK